MIRVASYCRVSTDHEDQVNSFAAQQRYFAQYIKQREEWELYAVYADEGISGTSTRKRAQFNRMIHDAYLGRFQLILTKEVSRFSRNILDTIAYTRELKALGIGVLFVTDGINTLEPDAELRLSIMASIAQEESRKTSLRVKWGQTRRMEQGVVFGRSLLGYDVADGALRINPAGADLVRLIFHKYGIEKKGTTVIARELREAGYRTYLGSTDWTGSHILKILKNEKYVGDLVQKKTFTPDYLPHEKKTNRGEEAVIIQRNHHQPIIDRELWDIVQEELRLRNRRQSSGCGCSTHYAFSGKIKCGECGASFISRSRKQKSGRVQRWMCYTAASRGKEACGVGQLLGNDTAEAMFHLVLSQLHLDTEHIAASVAALAAEAMEQDTSVQSDHLSQKLSEIETRQTTLWDTYFAGDITRETAQTMNAHYAQQKRQLQAELNHASELLSRSTSEAELQHVAAALLTGERHSEELCKTLLESITVRKDGRLELKFKHIPHIFQFSH